MDEATHKALTGVSNKQILQNIRMVSDQTDLILRYPPDPDLNGKVAILLTFVGNSPIVFVGPLCAWLCEVLGGWSPVFVVLAVCATVVLIRKRKIARLMPTRKGYRYPLDITVDLP